MKYKTLLIDDNRMAIESLKKTIPWDSLRLELIGCAYDGKQGLEIIRAQKPDVIISDIHMPELDGLNMIEALGDGISDSRVIFITAYEKIEYATRAIRLSAFDFILKPVDNNDLCSSLKRAVSSLDSERSETAHRKTVEAVAKRARFIAALNSAAAGEQGGVFSFLDRTPAEFFVILAQSRQGVINGPSLQRLDYADFPEGAEVISAVVEGDLVLLCAFARPLEQWHSQARQVADVLLSNMLNVTLSVSDHHLDISELRLAYEESMHTQLQHNIYGKHTEVDFFDSSDLSSSKRTHLADIEQMCSRLAANIDVVEPEEVWNTIMEKSDGKIRMIKVMLMFICTKVTRNKMNHSCWGDSTDMIVYELPKLQSVEGARQWLFHFFEEIRNINIPASTSLVGNVLEYVNSHITEGLVLEDVAAKFFVSPNYLSMLIKKETGITYRQHVIDAKMVVAKQMLDDTRMRVEDIAYAIGYENYISFYNIFKKSEKMSPTEYRLNKHEE